MGQLATVKYQIATYSGEVQVLCNEDDDNEVIIAKAKSSLKRKSSGVPLPFGYESFKIINRKNT